MCAYRRVISAILAILFALALAAPALAVTPSDYSSDNPANLEPDHLYAESALLMDMDTGEILLTKNSRVRVYPASTTKIMTLLLAVESDIPMSQTVTIPAEAGNVPEGSSVIGIKPGDRMTWEDLLYSFMLRSGNDGSNAIAVLVSGGIDAFVNQMNLRAMQLGCEGTHFVNAHGYQNQDHYTTAMDLARISVAAMQNETFRKIAGTGHWKTTVTRNGKTGSSDMVNRNSLLLSESKYYYSGATGIKTGHHKQAGRCVVASAERSGVNLLAVVMDCATEDRQWADAHKLLNYGYTQYSAYSMQELLNTLQTEICSVQLDNVTETDPNGGRMLLGYGNIVNGNVSRMVQRNSETAMRYALDAIRDSMEITWNRELRAPVSAGEVLGVARFSAPDGSEVSAELIASRDVEAKPEPTPTPTPAPTKRADARRAKDEAQTAEGGQPERVTSGGNAKNRLLMAVIATLIVLSLGLLVWLLVYSHIRKERARKAAAARKRAAARRRRAQGSEGGRGRVVIVDGERKRRG